MLNYNGFNVYWDGHASVRVIDDGFQVAVDPFGQVSPDFEADLVLITQDGAGYYDREKIEAVCKQDTCVVLPSCMKDKEVPCDDVEFIGEGEVMDVFGIEIESMPLHENEGSGYCFVMRGTSFYVAGETGLMDEIWELEGRVDVCLLPVEGKDAMDVGDAVKAAVRIKPSIVVPYHFGKPFFETDIDLQGFSTELKDRNIGCKVLGSMTQ